MRRGGPLASKGRTRFGQDALAVVMPTGTAALGRTRRARCAERLWLAAVDQTRDGRRSQSFSTGGNGRRIGPGVPKKRPSKNRLNCGSL